MEYEELNLAVMEMEGEGEGEECRLGERGWLSNRHGGGLCGIQG